nr:MAG TPA: tail fiber protein [Bacteriophage sp.]
MEGKQVTELDALPSFTDTSLLPVHNGAGLKKGLLSQLANYLGKKFSNPNLLINPNFEINQRGSTTYTTGYTVDRWRVEGATLNAKTKTLSNPNSAGGTFLQSLENKPTGTFTVTLNVASVTGTVKFSWKDGSTYKTGAVISKGLNTYTFTASSLTWVGIDVASGASIQLDYMKLEQGSVATHFVTPNKAEELAKCQYYTVIFEPLRTILNADTDSSVINIDTRCKMRTKPTVSYITLKSGAQNQFNFISILSSKAYYALKTDKWTSFIDTKNEVIVVNTGTGISSGAFGQVTFDNNLMLDAEIY